MEYIGNYKNIDKLLDKNIRFVGTSKKIKYANIPCAFDTEASSFYDNGQKRAIMYIWVLGLNDKVITGRTYDELLFCLDKISKFYELDINKRIIIYVHNLAYDFQFIIRWFNWIKIFATDERQPLTAVTDNGFEFRDSLRLSGYSLEKTAEHLQSHDIKKQVGDLEYKLIRHSKTPLTDKELNYVLYDAYVLLAYIEEKIEEAGNITRIQLTKTGEVRKYVRDNCLYEKSHKNNPYKYIQYRRKINKIPVSNEYEYLQLKRAFAGGFTHANGLYVGEVVKKVASYDFTSAYPYVMVAEKYPVGEAQKIQIRNKDELERNLKAYCCLFDITFYNLRSKVDYEHTISVSKCYNLVNYIADNGRIVEADELGTTLTEQDYFIIQDFYTWERATIKNFRRYVRGYLPKAIIEAVIKLYNDKTTLKGVEGMEAEYMNGKEKLNSCYGCTVTDICRPEITFNGENWINSAPDIKEALEKYNCNKRRFLAYQWGVWITAYNRRNLFKFIKEFNEDYIYADTDSVKGINYEKHKAFIEKYNRLVDKKLQLAMDYHKLDINLVKPRTKEGELKVLGYADFDGFYLEFKTLGAKRYMVLTDKGYNLTVSGLNKKTVIPYLLKTYGEKGIMKAFTDGLKIPKGYTGKNIHTYIDNEQMGFVTDYLGNTASYYEKSSVHMEEAEYELSLTKEYIDYLLGVKELKH